MDQARNYPAYGQKISAIIPAYNEAERIGSVLKVAFACPHFDEVIVVDDGSRDNTEAAAKKYPVEYLRLPENRGKARAMDAGVKMARNDIIFFIDADVRGLTEKIIAQVIAPVARREAAMFIATRNRKIYLLSFLLIFLPVLGGERALRRGLWERLPDFFKHRFRVEAGLNFFARYYDNDFSYAVFPGLTQTIKEKKYGLYSGFKQRAGMMWDVFYAQLALAFFYAPDNVIHLRDAFWSGLGTFIGLVLITAAYIGPRRFIYGIFAAELAEDPSAPIVNLLLGLSGIISIEILIVAGFLISLINIIILTANLKLILPFFRLTWRRRKAVKF